MTDILESEEGDSQALRLLSIGLLLAVLIHVLVHAAGNMRSTLFPLLKEEFNPKLKEALLDPLTGRLPPHNIVLANGRSIYFLEGLETRLKNGDTVVLPPPVGGE